MELEIREVKNCNGLYKLLNEEKAANYFILQGIYTDTIVFIKMFELYQSNELIGGLFIRKSGNAHIYIKRGTSIQMVRLYEFLLMQGVKEIYAVYWIGKFLEQFVNTECEVTSYISRLSKQQEFSEDEGVVRLFEKDIKGIISIYKKCFNHFTPESIMLKNLYSGGLAYSIRENNEIISISQSIFQDESSVIIFGVATNPEYRRKGLSYKILNHHINELLKNTMEIFLLYIDETAGKLYKKLGFEIIDRMVKIKLS